MTLKTIFINSLLAVLLGGCASSGTPSADGGAATTEIDSATAKKIAAAAVPGTLSEPRKLDSGDERRWLVVVTLSNGASVDVEIARSNGTIEEIKGEERPFDYEIPAPKAGLLTYAQAKAKALAAKTGDVELWEVKPPSNLYEFYVRDATKKLWEIKMTADKGDIQSTVEKDKPD